MSSVKRLRSVYLFLLFPVLAGAQPMRSLVPYRYSGGAEEATRRQARLAMPSLRLGRALPAAHRLTPLRAEELTPEIVVSRAKRAGVHRPVPTGAPEAAGVWSGDGSGGAVWRMVLESPGAAGVRMHFRNFRLGPGARVWLHDGSGAEAEIMGPYEGRGVWGDGEFWSDFVLSERIVVEYQPGPASAGGGGLPFEIAGISHLLPGVVASAGVEVRQAAASCNLDISCYPEWAETARAVAHIVFEEGGSSYVCSGTLLRTTTANNIPYFLTADHCVSTDAVARTVQSFWQYQTTRCNGPAPNKRDAQRTLGARYILSQGVGRGDYSLIRLNSVPDGVVFAGWTTDVVDLGAQVVGIHHPTGDYKRFSRGNRTNTGTQLPGANPAFYYTVNFTEGIIEGGSSGSGLFSAPGVLVGSLSSGLKVETPCERKPYPANYGRFSDAFTGLRDYLEGRNTSIPGTPSGGGPDPQVLSSGAAREFSIGPVESPTLISGSQAYAIDVPEGASRLTIRVASTGDPAEIGLWGRFDAAPVVENGRVVADYASPGVTGTEEITIDARSNPALRAGRYYVALGLFTANVTARGTITATVTLAPPSNSLVSGEARSFSIGPVSGGTLYNGQNGFRIEVPEGARRLDIRLEADRPELDIDLHVRYGQDVSLSNRTIVSDFAAAGDTGVESLAITASTSPPLRAGTYFIAIGLFARDVTVTGKVTATVSGAGNVLVSGTPALVETPAVTGASLLGGSLAYQIVAPQGATRLDVRLSNGTAGVDYDLFVRRNAPPEVQGGRVVADYRSEGATGDELVTITPASNPALEPGTTYYAAIGVFTPGVAGSVALTATAGGGVPGAPGSALTPGVMTRVEIGAVSSARLLAGPAGYYVTVPAGSQRLELQLRTAQEVDLDLFVRAETPPSVQGGVVQADYRATGATGNETIVMTGSAARPLQGTYFIGIGVFTTGVDIGATLTATLTGSGGGPLVLQPGVAQSFALTAVSSAQLAPQQFAIDVPDGAARLEIRLASSTADVDVDLYARYNAAPVVSGGHVQADYTSEGPNASELITITPASSPALRGGRYYVALGVFTTGVPIEGTLVATVVAGSSSGGNPPPEGSRVLSPESPVKFNLPAVDRATLFRGDYSFRLTVPEGTRSMQIRLTADAPSVDTDLYVRFGADVELVNGEVAADYAAESSSGNELLTVGPESAPPLRPGEYWVALGLFTRNTPASGTISVAFERGLGSSSAPAMTVLKSGGPSGPVKERRSIDKQHELATFPARQPVQ